MALLEVKGLVKAYGRRRVVDGVDFEVNAGEVVGLLGPNGAGKTTSFRMTTGQVSPLYGKVFFNGQDVTHLPMYMRARLGMGYLAQETSVFRKLTVEQNILAVLEIMPAIRTLGRALTRKERFDRTEQALHQFGLLKIRNSIAARISGGEKRRLEIARCLVCEPLLILLDEPFTGIDPVTIADIQEIVRELRRQGIGMLLTDHNVREALKITTRSYLIQAGKVRTHGTPQEIVNDPIAIKEYLGQGFNDNFIGDPTQQYTGGQGTYAPPPVYTPPPPPQPMPAASEADVEKYAVWIEDLKSANHSHAAVELVEAGVAAVPALVAALERRDVELRRQALTVLQAILGKNIVFDPYAPEILRKQQIGSLREQYERRAG